MNGLNKHMQVEICSIRQQLFYTHKPLYDPLHLRRRKCKNSELKKKINWKNIR